MCKWWAEHWQVDSTTGCRGSAVVCLQALCCLLSLLAVCCAVLCCAVLCCMSVLLCLLSLLLLISSDRVLLSVLSVLSASRWRASHSKSSVHFARHQLVHVHSSTRYHQDPLHFNVHLTSAHLSTLISPAQLSAHHTFVLFRSASIFPPFCPSIACRRVKQPSSSTYISQHAIRLLISTCTQSGS